MTEARRVRSRRNRVIQFDGLEPRNLLSGGLHSTVIAEVARTRIPPVSGAFSGTFTAEPVSQSGRTERVRVLLRGVGQQGDLGGASLVSPFTVTIRTNRAGQMIPRVDVSEGSGSITLANPLPSTGLTAGQQANLSYRGTAIAQANSANFNTRGTFRVQNATLRGNLTGSGSFSYTSETAGTFLLNLTLRPTGGNLG
jgi:hypothetical protein